MYFLQQIKSQFISTLYSYADAPGEGDPVGGRADDENQASNEKYQKLTPEDRAKLQDLEGLQKEIDVIRASEHIVKGQILSFGNNLERIASGNEPGLSKDDPEYKELKAKYERLIGVYEELVGEGQMINHIVRYRLSELEGTVEEQIDEIKTGEETGEAIDSSQEDADYHAEKIGREIFIQKLSELSENTPQEDMQKLATEFGVGQIHSWIEGIQSEIEETENTEEKSKLEENLRKIQAFIASLETRNFDNMSELQSISMEDFIGKVAFGERLQYFTRSGVKSSEIQQGQNLEMTFTFEGVYNSKLEALTAGQIFPENVVTIVVDGKEFQRKGLRGEFYSQELQGQRPERLFIQEGETLRIEKLRTSEDIAEERQSIEAQLEGVPEDQREIQRAALERGISTLDDGTVQVLTDIINQTEEGVRPAELEARITDIAESVGPGLATNPDGTRPKGLLGLLIMLLETLSGEKIYEDTEESSSAENAGRPSTSGDSSFSRYAGEIGISPEDVAKYGSTGSQLATWLQSSGFPVFNGKPYYCGQNVGMALNAFGITGLPTSGRHGYRWAEICGARPDKFRKLDCTPQNAPAGAIISYNKGTGGSTARQGYGHVEIALGQNTGYYFGTVASRPGGSNPNFAAGTYQIYMPISK